ncbi:MAG: AAA family ATPase [Clostridia bacterium]|nr:AAA family ATPase [Clostridia bacterium]
MNTMNIPVMSVSDIVKTLTLIYEGKIKAGEIPHIPAIFIWGPPGVGKSNGMHQLAEDLGKLCGVKVCVTDVRLLLFSPVDLRGVPVKQEEFTAWLKPKIFDMSDEEGVVNLLFLDELSAAPQSVQAAAYQLCLDKKIGEHKLPENTIVVAAGNRLSDQSVSFKMPKALCNRFLHFEAKCDHASWHKWAVKAAIDPRVISFIAYNEERLEVVPDSADLAYPTPRSWEFVSRVISGNEDIDTLTPIVAASVGMDTALEFATYCKGIMKMPNVEEIFSGMCREIPRSYDVMHALVTSLVSRVARRGATREELTNLCNYAVKMPPDFAYCLATDLNLIPGISEKLMMCPSYGKLMIKK